MIDILLNNLFIKTVAVDNFVVFMSHDVSFLLIPKVGKFFATPYTYLMEKRSGEFLKEKIILLLAGVGGGKVSVNMLSPPTRRIRILLGSMLSAMETSDLNVLMKSHVSIVFQNAGGEEISFSKQYLFIHYSESTWKSFLSGMGP